MTSSQPKIDPIMSVQNILSINLPLVVIVSKRNLRVLTPRWGIIKVRVPIRHPPIFPENKFKVITRLNYISTVENLLLSSRENCKVMPLLVHAFNLQCYHHQEICPPLQRKECLDPLSIDFTICIYLILLLA